MNNHKVLFISPFRDGTGYGSAALSYIEAFDNAGIDIAIRCVKYNDYQAKLKPRILELEQKSSQGCDIVIQYTLPHAMSYNGHFKKNIAMFESESSNFIGANWHTHLNLMDEVWAVNKEQLQTLKNSNVTVPVKYIGHAVDTEKFQQSYPKLPIGAEDKFVFYFVGEFTRRKNFGAIIKAFHAEFGINEPVALLFKVSIPGVSPQECAKRFTDYCIEVRKGLKLYYNIDTYHKEYVIVDRLSEEVLYSLYNACDCFVNASRGEGWNIPCAESAAMGKAIISGRCGGMLDYLTDETAWLVDGCTEPCFGEIDTLPELHRADEDCFEIGINGLREAMRQAFENKELRQAKSEKCVENIFTNFNKNVIGQRAKKLLEEIA